MLQGKGGHDFPIRVAPATLSQLAAAMQRRRATPVCAVGPLTVEDLDDLVDQCLACGRGGRDSVDLVWRRLL